MRVQLGGGCAWGIQTKRQSLGLPGSADCHATTDTVYERSDTYTNTITIRSVGAGVHLQMRLQGAGEAAPRGQGSCWHRQPSTCPTDKDARGLTAPTTLPPPTPPTHANKHIHTVFSLTEALEVRVAVAESWMCRRLARSRGDVTPGFGLAAKHVCTPALLLPALQVSNTLEVGATFEGIGIKVNAPLLCQSAAPGHKLPSL